MSHRLRPLEPSEWNAAARRLLGGTEERVSSLEGGAGGVGTGPPNILRVIAHHPTLLEPFLGFAAALATRGVLARRDSELLALRAAWNCRSAFEWGHHVLYARAAGLGDDEIERIARGPLAEGWSAYETLLLQAADALHGQQQIPDGIWSELAEILSEAQLLELPFVVGQYTMLSMVANATAVPLEPALPPLGAARGTLVR